jgi:hypothetical protein
LSSRASPPLFAADPRVEEHNLRALKAQGGPRTHQGHASPAQLQRSVHIPFRSWDPAHPYKVVADLRNRWASLGYRFRDFDRGGSALAANGTDVRRSMSRSFRLRSHQLIRDCWFSPVQNLKSPQELEEEDRQAKSAVSLTRLAGRSWGVRLTDREFIAHRNCKS